MDKNAIKKYAIWARNELIAKISQKAAAYGIEKDNIVDANADSIDGIMFSSVEKKQRKALIEQINDKGYEQVIEEVAYTWFNRFTAIRFMEVNGYLPSHIRVFTDDDNNFKPQILTEAIHLNDIFEKINMEKVLELKQEDKTEELYKYLLIIQCNALNAVLPRMFQKIEDYSELLLPDYLLRDGSVLEQLVTLIPEEDWQDQVQIIGWLYQYYNSEPKDAVFAALKKNVKITKENIPAATQLFTPDWIVRYMVENSLGRLWLEGHPNDDLKSEWKYYLEEAEQEEKVQKQLDEIRKEYAQLKPEDIKCIDPCMGSGHILCYMFDVLVKIYEDYGYTARDAASSIVEKNLWGLDIDERAAQLSYFAVMMKARQYDRRFLTRGLQPHVYAIEESNGISSASLNDMGINLSEKEYSQAVKEAMRLVNEMHDAKEYGSIIDVTPCEWNQLRKFVVPRQSEDGQITFDINGKVNTSKRLQRLVDLGETLSQKYQVVITNPPYIVSSKVSVKLSEYIKKYYSEYKSDLYSVFIKKCNDLLDSNGYQSMITQHTWMYLSSFVHLRKKIISEQLVSLIHLGAHAFEEISGEVVQTASFVVRKTDNNGFNSSVIRLVDYQNESEKQKAYLKKKITKITTSSFLNIEGYPIAYRATEKMLSVFNKSSSLSNISNPKQGLISGNVNKFVRKWYECSIDTVSFSNDKSKKWFPYNNGGECRRWYGNNDDVVNWENDGFDIQNYKDEKGKLKSRPQNKQFYFMEGGTWTAISSGRFSVRYFPQGFLFSNAGMAIYSEHDILLYLIGFLNSKLSQLYLDIFNEGLNYNQGDIAKLPIIINKDKIEMINSIVKKCIEIEKEDWDSYETSWGFRKHPMIDEKYNTIKEAFDDWKLTNDNRTTELKKLEELLNESFIKIYGLENEVSPEVDINEITLKRVEEQTAVYSLISYAVGCMFGRYSLDKEGIVFAGGDWDEHVYNTYAVDEDAIIPISDDKYLKDDVVERFVDFIEKVYGKESLEENLLYIAQVIGGIGSSREIIRKYFINDFYTNHLKMYKKRPIYWLFDSGKNNGFKCLVYYHRYSRDTIARMRTDYVHEIQSRYVTEIKDLEKKLLSLSTKDKLKVNNRLSLLKKKSQEIGLFEEKIHHLADQMIELDIDSGVLTNYDIFRDVLANM